MTNGKDNPFYLYKIPAKTLFIGQNLVFVPQCHSTNTLAGELIRNKEVAEGTIVITSHQTAGKGQRGNTWETEPAKNLTFSVILKPTFVLAKDQFYLTIVVSLALRDFLASRLSSEIKIKWPNDILVAGNKICGILIENILSMDAIQHCIVGVGLNVNQKSFSIKTATSMTLIAESEFDLAAELNLLLEKLEGYYLQLRSGKKELLKAEYLSHLFRINELQRFVIKEEIVTATITGVGDSGRLTVLLNNEEASFDLKEIAFIN